MAQQTAILVIIPNASGDYLSYRLMAGGKVVWSNRVHLHDEGRSGARARLILWARKRGIEVRDAEGMVIVECAKARQA